MCRGIPEFRAEFRGEDGGYAAVAANSRYGLAPHVGGLIYATTFNSCFADPSPTFDMSTTTDKPAAKAAACSGFRGVMYHKTTGRYRVRVHTVTDYVYFGSYDDPILAAKVYDVVACMAFGPKARLNFDGRLPDGITETQLLRPFLKKGYNIHQLYKNWRIRTKYQEPRACTLSTGSATR